ncbi:MAG: tRNA (adenosine(37)-N6)-dimethylallyltransferase MiaA [Bacteroidia bacterium]
MSKKLLVAIVGPTAVGKTALAINLAEKFHTEIISADSRQFYREMEIGTAKPSLQELKKIPHHFINNLSINEEYNAGRYEKESLERLHKLFEVHDIVILVGGSGLFINALCSGFDKLPEGDAKFRARYEAILKDKGIGIIQQELEEKDPEYFNIVDKNNPRRLLRALEVINQTGMPYSSYRKKEAAARDFSILKIGLNISKEELRERIEKRIDDMLANGWLDECRKLFEHRELNALKTVGYTELFDFIEGKNDRDTTVKNIKTNTWRYAKRQLTWLKKDNEIKWYSPDEIDAIINSIKLAAL